MKTRITIQILSLFFFFYLLWQTTFPLVQGFIPVDLYLRLDPLVTTLIPVVSRAFIENLLPGFFVLILTLIFGRVFCGYLCPMGISLDLARFFIKPKKSNEIHINPLLRQIKYFLLTIIAVAAIFGVSHIFWGSPIALITRFYVLLIHPILQLLGSIGLINLRPFFESQNFLTLAYAQINPHIFHTVYFIAFFFILIFIFERVKPRFWCRYLCPAGAILALLSLYSPWKRRVQNCVHCGKCVKKCPTGAISTDGDETKHSECITCHTCVNVCPVQAVSFGVRTPKTIKNYKLSIDKKSVKENTLAIPSRRTFMGATALGSGLAALAYINSSSFYPKMAKASTAQLGLIRPPGAIPEASFLAKCLRCGQCMKACPTNALQPSWFISGFEGIFSPVLNSRIGPCEPECNVCGNVCPTKAILPLPLEDKRQAKIGTAIVEQKFCLAFANNRSCVVCQEVCPYGAIELKVQGSNKVPVPIISEARCFGCGFCEKHCPVHVPAITVQPINALRLPSNTYAEEAKSAGFDLRPVSMRLNHGIPDFIAPDELPPGFTE